MTTGSKGYLGRYSEKGLGKWKSTHSNSYPNITGGYDFQHNRDRFIKHENNCDRADSSHKINFTRLMINKISSEELNQPNHEISAK